MTTDVENDEIIDFYVFDLPHKLYERVPDQPPGTLRLVPEVHEWMSEQIQDEWLFESHLNTGRHGLSRVFYATLTFADRDEATIFKMVWL